MKAENIIPRNFRKSIIFVWIVLGILILVWIFVFTDYLSLYSNDTNYVVINNNYSDDIKCKVPKLDPWDPSIFDLIEHPKNLTCPQVQPFMTYVDYDGFLRINITETKSIGYPFKCNYRTFDRRLGLDDNAIAYDKPKVLLKAIKLDKDTVEVICKYENSTAFYFNIHAHPVKSVERIFAEPTESQLSVLLFMIDSTSYSVLQRNLPLTYNYTKNVMGMKYFNAYNKVGDNSYPNLMAMLLGKRVVDEQDDMLQEMNANNETYFDAWAIIWKMFAAKGYATVYNEDMPHFGLFHYMLKGFVKKPADFYYHLFWNAITAKRNDFCFYNNPIARIHLDITRRHMITMKDRLQFVYSILSQHAHDYENDIERVDEEMVSFWKQLYVGGYLNKTVIIFCSDHGIRFGKIRSSIVGLLEERLPFYGIWFPDWFYRKHPHLKYNIENNMNLLSSSFDVYETLQDILNENYNEYQRNFNSRGLSQLYPVPKNRTCKSAGIPQHYCTCLKEKILNNTNALAIDAARHLVKHLNFILTNFSDLCQVITFSKLLYAKEVDYEQKLKSNIHSYTNAKLFDTGKTISRLTRGLTIETLEIGLETNPFKARFEAMLKSDISIFRVKTWKLLGGISRISKYEGLSDCINDKSLRKICSCKINNNNTNQTRN